MQGVLSTLASGIYTIGGTMLGVGWQGRSDAPPTLEVFNNTIRTVCPPFRSNNPDLLFCDSANLGPLQALFPQNALMSVITGSLVMASGLAVGLIPTCFQGRPDGNKTKQFVDNMAPTARNILYTVGAAQMGNGLQFYLDQTLPALQQVLDGLCIAEPITSNTTMLCNMAQLKSIAVLFAQPSTTPLVIGGVLLAGILIGSTIYTLNQCQTDTNNSDEEIRLTNTNEPSDPPVV
jgi:hypothetical protein